MFTLTDFNSVFYTGVLNAVKQHLNKLRVAALKQITKNSFKPAAPQISKWKDTINKTYKPEMLNHRIRNVVN